MNFLAHQQLSGSNSGLRVGNFIGDFVKGNKWQSYIQPIQQGIIMHRSIDFFTDTNAFVHQSISILKPYLGRYSGIANDIFFDHFLAKNWGDYSNQSLEFFCNETYTLIRENELQIPERSVYVLNYMQQQNWLFNYQFMDGIKTTMHGMARRTKQPLFENSHIFLEKHYDELFTCFSNFFPLLQEHCKQFIDGKL